jgi:hypothetical protein
MKHLILGLILIVLIAGCSPSDRTMATAYAQALTNVPTSTPENTYTPYPTYTFVPTYTPWVVTATSSPTPLFTPTVTFTSTVTSTPTRTIDPLRTNRSPGIYLVGVNIAPGVWRSLGTGNNCYWATTNRTGDIISNYFGFAGGTMYIPASAFQVEMDENCGRWEFYQAP